MEKNWYQWYDQGIPPVIDFPQVALRDLFNRNAAQAPEKPYIIFQDSELSYAACNDMARRLGNALLSLGAAKGDRIAYMMLNIPQHVISIQACYKIGAIQVGMNPLYTVPELAYQLKDCGARTLIVQVPFVDKAIELMNSGQTDLQEIIVVNFPGMPPVEEGRGIYDFQKLLAAAGNEEPAVEVSPDDIAMLQYTGGTTGVSKGCCLTNRMIIAQCYIHASWVGQACPPDEMRNLAAIPLYHIYGYNTNVNMTLMGGGTLILVMKPEIDELLKNINLHEPTVFCAVPAMVIGLLNHPDTPASKIASIRGLFCGSAPLAVETINQFEKISGAVIMEGYGLSETTNILTINPVRTKRKVGSVGVPLPNTDIKIVDLEEGTRELPRGEFGELIARGPQIMEEYWNNPEETALAIRDGWLYTGDIAYMDEDGFVFIVDRKKDMIICSGFNVYPRDIDELLYAHPKVLEACAVGVPDAKRGETVKAFVVLKPGETMTAEEVKEYCRRQLAPYKVPTAVEFMDVLPRTNVGKPMRRVLRDQEIAKTK